MGEYLSIKEAAAKWGVSERRVNQFCAAGRIEGARKLGGVWAIPAEAEKPSDPRREKKKGRSRSVRPVIRRLCR